MTTATAPVPAPGRATLYWRAMRARYVPTSVVPAAAGGLVAIGTPGAQWWLLPVALLSLALVHGATNVVNDVEDFANGVDGPDKMDNSRVFNTGLLSLREGRLLGLATFAAAAALGLVIVAAQGPWILAYGVPGLLAGYLYTAGPRPYKYVGVADPLLVLVLGPLLTQGAYTAVTGDPFDAAAFWVGLMPGLLVTAVVQGNNASDIDSDAAAGVRTLAVRTGPRGARALYAASLVLGYLALPALVATGLFGPAVLLPLLTLPMAAGPLRDAMRGDAAALATLAPRTARLHLAASALLVLGVVVDRVT